MYVNFTTTASRPTHSAFALPPYPLNHGVVVFVQLTEITAECGVDLTAKGMSPHKPLVWEGCSLDEYHSRTLLLETI